MALAALSIGLAGAVVHARGSHPNDTEHVMAALLAGPSTLQGAIVRNDTAYEMLTRPGSGPEAWEAALRLASLAVEETGRRDPALLDTLAVARFLLGQIDEASALLEEALGLGPPEPLRQLLEHRLTVLRSGEALELESEPD